MSRIGRKPIVIPTGVEVKIDGSNITVKGPKGTLDSKIHPMMTAKVENGEVVVTRPNDEKEARSLHGLTRTLISNMVEGVTNGFKKELEIQGVGYRAAKQGKNLVMNLGYSHQVIVPETDGITIDVPDPLKIVINGIDKQRVGQFAAEVREKRPPEPYKGKGIRYAGEYVATKRVKPARALNKRRSERQWLINRTRMCLVCADTAVYAARSPAPQRARVSMCSAPPNIFMPSLSMTWPA